MKKLVINKCYGGFGLSEAAIRTLHGRGCGHVKLIAPTDWYGKRFSEKEFQRDLERGWLFLIDGRIADDEHKNQRDCPSLAAVVEEMGAAADGDYARLAVVEIPDDIEFTVEEYDGREHVAESHRVWR